MRRLTPSKRRNLEAKMQAEFVMWFGQEYPLFLPLLLEINNDVVNPIQAMQRLAKGMRPSASDMILFSPINAKPLCMEFKAPGMRHSVKHLKAQIKWGRKVYKAGGSFIMTHDINKMKEAAIRHITQKRKYWSEPPITRKAATYLFPSIDP